MCPLSCHTEQVRFNLFSSTADMVRRRLGWIDGLTELKTAVCFLFPAFIPYLFHKLICVNTVFMTTKFL